MNHQNIMLPGVYFYNAGASSSIQGTSIFCSIGTNINLSTLGINDSDNKVLVFPKYKILLYAGSYADTPTVIDNTNGTKCLYVTGTNSASVCRVYYNGVEIPECISSTGN